MSGPDDHDKTVFQPRPASGAPASPANAGQAQGDSTLIVPRPGGGQAAGAPPAGAQAAPPTAAHTPPPPAATTGTPEPTALNLEGGINRLVTCAATLLSVITRLRSHLEQADAPALQRQLAMELRQFEQRAKGLGIRPELVITARYLLCTALDETVMNTPWGAAAGWSQRSLLSVFHNETFGGEKFFAILQRLLETPAESIEVLELIDVLLGLGFEGKYRVDPRGRDQIELIRDNLYRTIEQQRGAFEPELAPHWRSQVTAGKRLMEYLPVWVVASCVLVVLLLCYSGYRLWLHQATQPVAMELQTLQERPTGPNNPTVLR